MMLRLGDEYYHFSITCKKVLQEFIVLYFSPDNGWLFSHEAGHCLGGMHLRPNGKKTKTARLLSRCNIRNINIMLLYICLNVS